MSSETVIRARALSKCYPVFERPEDRLKQMLSFGRRKYYREFWAIKNVDLDIYRGETVGIVGRNGSGKSTLLQIICGILAPTTGELVINGRVAALLELGAGFNLEFTGRENVFMNASILGLRQEEIQRRFDSIAQFADIGDFINQPVKTYSSGMYARLAFAVAINVDPDILIVDEALSVGDEAFQRKCFGRIEQIRKRGGTILFVSHVAGTVVELCNRAVLLDQGECLMTEAPKSVVNFYQKMLYAKPEEAAAIRAEIRATEPLLYVVPGAGSAKTTVGTSSTNNTQEIAEFDPALVPKSTLEYPSRGAVIGDVHIEDSIGRRVNVLVRGQTYRYCYSVSFAQDLKNVRFGMLLKTVSGFEVGGQYYPANEGIDVDVGDHWEIAFEFENRFLSGTYFGNAGVVIATNDGSYLHRLVDATMFRVKHDRNECATVLIDLRPRDGNGVTLKKLDIEIDRSMRRTKSPTR